MNGTGLLLLKAAFKRPRKLTEESVVDCQTLVTTAPYFKVDYTNYQRYELSLDWPTGFMHPCYLQMVALPLQLSLLVNKKSPFRTLGLVHIHNYIEQHH